MVGAYPCTIAEKIVLQKLDTESFAAFNWEDPNDVVASDVLAGFYIKFFITSQCPGLLSSHARGVHPFMARPLH